MISCKLENLYCTVHKLDVNNNFYEDINVKISDSPWIYYLNTNDESKIIESFKATQKNINYSNNYSYDIKQFNKLYKFIKLFEYNNIFNKNKIVKDIFQNKDWSGGNGPVKIWKDKKNIFRIGDGHHRCAILYYLYGPNKIIYIKDCILQDVDKL